MPDSTHVGKPPLASSDRHGHPYPTAPTFSTRERGDVSALGSAHATTGASPAVSSTCRPSLIIGIAGGSCSGKTTLCRRVIDSLGFEDKRVAILTIDSFYRDLPEDVPARDFNFDHPEAFDWALCVDTLRKLRAGEPAEVPVYSYGTFRRVEDKTRMIHGVDVVLFEGILALHDPEILDLLALKVFVEEDADVRLMRRVERDTVGRGRTVEDVLDRYCRNVKVAYDDYIGPTKKKADLIVPHGASNDVALSLLVGHIRSICAEQNPPPLSL